MKKNIAKLLVLVIAISLFSGCANKNKIGDELKTIKLWSGYCMIAEDELEMEKSEWILTKLVDKYNEIQDDIRVEFSYFDDDDVMLQTLKASVAEGKDIPDIVVVQSGVYLEDLKDIFTPINNYLSEDYKSSTRYWETTTFSDEIYGYPTTGANVTYFAYNKALINQAGLDFENNPPTTVEEFLSACETIKAEGIVPITAGDYECNDFFSTLVSKWWVQDTGIDGIKQHGANKTSFSSDQGFINACSIVQDMWNAGYIINDYVTNEDTISDLADGKAAMYNSFVFELGLLEDAMGENLGILLVPDLSASCINPGLSLGSCNQCMSITRSSNNKEECVRFIEWLLNRENSIELYKKYKGLPIRKDISLKDLGWDENEHYAKLYPCVENIATYPEYMVMGIGDLADTYYTYGPQLITGEISPSRYAELLDQANQ